jgi:hypothetical protein
MIIISVHSDTIVFLIVYRIDTVPNVSVICRVCAKVHGQAYRLVPHVVLQGSAR